jgi:hypothetical protein
MTFEQYQTEWNALKAGVLSCIIKPYHAIECLIAMKYTAKEAETEIENWLFEAQITVEKALRDSGCRHYDSA